MTQLLLKKYFLPAAFTCLLFNTSFSQPDEKTPVKFGKITVDDFKKDYSIDINAQAVVVADLGSSKFTGNSNGWFSLEFTRQIRIAILNKNGYDAGNFEIRLYRVNDLEEKLLNLKAVTYNLEAGKITETKLDKNSLFSETEDRNTTLKKFTMPGLQEGCIVEVEYKIKSDFMRYLRPWSFQGEYPVLWSEYEVGMPGFFSYIFLSQGYQPFYLNTKKDKQENYSVTINSSGGTSRQVNFSAGVTWHRWVMKNVPALKQEPFTSTLSNHISKIEFQLSEIREPLEPQSVMGTWKELNDELLNDPAFGLFLQEDNFFLNDEIPASVKQLPATGLKKAKLVFEYVRDRYTCTDDYARYLSQNFRSLVKKKNGNVADINLLLVALLRIAGYKADPVILGLRNRGIIYQSYPVFNRFNYVIAQLELNGTKYYLDAADPMLGFGKLGLLCYNGHARVIDGGPSELEINADNVTEDKTTSVFIITEADKFKGTLVQTPGYYESAGIRQSVNEKGLAAVAGELKKKFNIPVDISGFEVDSVENKEQPVSISYDFILKSENDGIIYFNPMAGEGFRSNPFTSEERLYPVEMPYAINETYSLTMNIPGGYKVEDLPSPLVLKLNEQGDGIFEYRVNHSGSVISLRCRLQIKRTLFEPGEYGFLREFFNRVVAKQNEMIVLKKNTANE